MCERKSIVTRVYVLTRVEHRPNGKRVTVPSHYRAPRR